MLIQTPSEFLAPAGFVHPLRDELIEFMAYDPVTGAITATKGRGAAKVGKVLGTVEKSRAGKLYKRVWFKGKRYYAHVLIAIMLGIFTPGLEVDHIDRDGLNNAVNNIRIVTHADNMKNRKPRQVLAA